MDASGFDLSTMVADSPVVDIVEQQRAEWFERRRGKFTCSRFGDIIGTGRGKGSEFTQRGWNYIYQLAAERLGSMKFEFQSAPTRWGNEHEAAAIDAWREQVASGPIEVVSGTEAFCEYAPHIGGTPDALIGGTGFDVTGCLEVKCPYGPEVHMQYVHEDKIPDIYVWQVIGHLLVSGAPWCAFISFDPRMEGPKRLFTKVLHREDAEERLGLLKERLDAAESKVQEVLASG